MAFHSNGQLFELIYIYNSSYTYFWSIEWYVTDPRGVDAHLMWTFSVFLTTRKKKISTLFEIRVNPVFDPSYTWSTLSA